MFILPEFNDEIKMCETIICTVKVQVYSYQVSDIVAS